MNGHATTTSRTGEQSPTDRTRDCERCGRDRPTDPQRFVVTASDHTDATADYERVLLCGACWRDVRDTLRRCFA